jgi:pimeloyl-ACP methyl ester carboxylesterase
MGQRRAKDSDLVDGRPDTGAMATYALIHGAGDSAWYWHLVAARLRGQGDDVVAIDLPIDDESATWSDYADAVIEGIGDRKELVVVAQSFGGFTAPLVCVRKPPELLVFIAGMIPAPGESANDYWRNTRYSDAVRDLDFGDEIAVFYHDVPPDLAREALEHGRRQAEAIEDEPWPLETWPDVPVRFLLCRDDRLFPASWLRGVVRERLGIEPDEIEGGHCPALARPEDLVERLRSFRSDQASTSPRLT